MDDQLIVAGGGSTAVAVDELFVEVARLARLAGAAREWAGQLAAIRASLDDPRLTGWAPAVGVPMLDSSSIGSALGGAAFAMERCARESDRLSGELMTSAERYGQAERDAQRRWHWLVGTMMWGVGTAAAPVVGLAGAAAALVALTTWIGGEPGRGRIDWQAVLSRPEFVALVRAAADSADELLAGLARIPAPLALQLGAESGAPQGAALLVAVAAAIAGIGPGGRDPRGGAIFVERGVSVERRDPQPTDASSHRTAAPTGAGDLAERLPRPHDDDAHVRIERYGEGDEARYIAYIAGTVTFDVHAGSEAFDMTSNLHGIADDGSSDVPPAGMERAVRAALIEAGAHATSPLLVVGYSGGGIAAADLAAASDLNVVGVLTLGSPTASAPPSAGVPVLALEHAEDLVPATGGAGSPSPDRVVVTRSALDGSPLPADGGLPAHALHRYQHTAQLADASEEARLVEFRQVVAGFAEGEAAEVSLWRARRSDPGD